MDRDLDSEAVESFTQDVVNCIRQFIDALRAEFPVTKQPLAAILQTSTKSPLLYTRLVERGIRKQVLETIKNQKELLGCGEFENITTAATLELSSANDLEGERYRLVHEILLPLIHSLSECYKILDQLPQPQPPQREEQTRRRNKAKPIPPKGMLSLQNYTDIACLLEFTICTSVLPILEPFVLISTEDRIRYHLPKSLAGRIPRNSLAWGAAQEKLTVKVTGNENLQQKQSRELIQTASVVATLVLLDRFRPMLLPRHAPDVYAAFFQAEHSMGYDYIKQQRQQYNIYNKLGLSLQHTQNMDAMLQAKAYQTLLLQGTKGPSWIRERVAPLLTELACKNLVAIVQVFVPLQEPSMASQRLGRALATSSSSPKTKPVASSLCRQMLGLLEVIFPKEGEIPAKAMAILQTIWAVLYEWPVEVVQNELIRVWEQGVLNSDGGKASTIHATIRQIGALCSFVPPSTMNPLSVVRWLFVPNRTMKKSIFFHLVRVASMPSILESTARNDARQTLQWLSHAMHSCNRTNEQANVRLVMNQGREEVVISGPDLLVSAWLHAIAPSSWDLAGNTYSPSSGAAPSAPNRGTMGPISALEKVEIRLQQDKNQIVDNIAGDCSKRAEVFVETIVMTCCRPEEECAPTEGKKESLSPTGMRGMPSRLFRLLLRVYLSSADIETKASKLGGGVQLAAISLIPILCEKCTPESLLFDDNENAIGLLRLIKLVLTCTKSRFENQARDAATLNAGYYDDEDEMITCLEQFVCLSLNEDSNIGELPPLLAGNDFEQDSTVLSIASIILSLLIAVLELGSKLRSVEEEEMLKSFLPVLQTLADFTDIVANASDSSFSFQNSNAGLADMAGYALALIASRQAPMKEKVPVEAIPFSTIEKLRKIIEEAEEDLGSTQPPLRARGMVSLGRLARGYLGIVPQEKVPFVVELDQAGPREEDPIAVLVQEVLRLSMVALSDSESYVYLAVSETQNDDDSKIYQRQSIPFFNILFHNRLYKQLWL